MTDYYVAALGLTRAEDLYISFRRLVRSDGVCWPLPWAGTWFEAAVVQAAAELNDGVESVAVPKDVVHGIATAPTAGRIDGDVGPVVRNSASNRRALVVAARRDIARMEAVGIPPAGDAARGDDDIYKALGTLLPLTHPPSELCTNAYATCCTKCAGPTSTSGGVAGALPTRRIGLGTSVASSMAGSRRCAGSRVGTAASNRRV